MAVEIIRWEIVRMAIAGESQKREKSLPLISSADVRFRGIRLTFFFKRQISSNI